MDWNPGAGQFWNEYNVYLPLDTLAIGTALLEWGHTKEALAYIGYFFSRMVCMQPVCVEPLVHQVGRILPTQAWGRLAPNIYILQLGWIG